MLAQALNKSVPTVSQIEAGEHPLDYLTLVVIARTLGVSHLRLILDAQRDTLAEDAGSEALLPVFESLVTKFEEIAKNKTKKRSGGRLSRPDSNGQA